MSALAAQQAAEAAARNAYGRLLALLAARTRDIAASEDALSEAFVAALRTWPVQGVPDRPEAWLMTAAKNRLSNDARHQAIVTSVTNDLALLSDEVAPDLPSIPDDRLRLLFVCAHPAIAEAVRAPLMLQTVLGLDAARIGTLFMVPASTMGQRLSRAKTKIRDAGLRFEVPEPDEWAGRLADVLDAVYAAYSSAWEAPPEGAVTPPPLAAEAIDLARLLVLLLPQEPEPRGLLSLMLHSEARRPARREAQGRYVPLDQQDPRLWQRALILEAEGLLTQGAQSGRFGRYLCEAAIQSVHAQRALTGRANHEALLTLYRLLLAHAPSVGAQVAYAAALLAAGQPDASWQTLQAVPEAQAAAYQPYWVTRHQVLTAQGDAVGALAALARALDLTEDAATRAYLQANGAARSV